MGKEVENYFQERASKYLKESQKGLWRFFREKERIALFNYIHLSPDDLVLDAGAGAGYYSLHLKTNYLCQVVAIDMTKAMVDELKKNGIDGRLSSLENFAGEERFDLILAAGVFEFLESPAKSLANMAAHLKNTGRMILLVPADGLAGFLYDLFHFNVKTFCRSVSDYESLAHDAGLKIIAIQDATVMSRVIVLEKLNKEI